MSHTTKIPGIKIVSVSALRSAVAELAKQGIKITLKEKAKPRAYYAQQEGMGVADFVVELGDSSYDVGLYKQADGSYEPRFDAWAGNIERILGAKASKAENTDQAKLGKLMQMYGVMVATEKAKKQGLVVRRIEGKDGAIKLVLNGFT